MDNMARIREILKELNYAVTLKQSEHGLSALFPHKKIGTNSPIEPINRYYAPVYESSPAGIDFYSSNLNPHNKFIECPAYAIRLTIACDVLSVCNYYGYDSKLIIVYDNQDKELSYNSKLKISELIKEVESQQHKELEVKLRDIIQQAIPANFTPKYLGMAKKQGVLDGYNFVKRILLGDKK